MSTQQTDILSTLMFRKLMSTSTDMYTFITYFLITSNNLQKLVDTLQSVSFNRFKPLQVNSGLDHDIPHIRQCPAPLEFLYCPIYLPFPPFFPCFSMPPQVCWSLWKPAWCHIHVQVPDLNLLSYQTDCNPPGRPGCAFNSSIDRAAIPQYSCPQQRLHQDTALRWAGYY